MESSTTDMDDLLVIPDNNQVIGVEFEGGRGYRERWGTAARHLPVPFRTIEGPDGPEGPQGVTDNGGAKKSVPSPPPSRGPNAAHTLDFGVEAVVGLVGLGARELEVVVLVRPDLAPLRVVPV